MACYMNWTTFNLQNQVHVLEAQMQTQDILKERKKDAFNKVCETNIELLQKVRKFTELISKLRNQTVMLNQQVDNHRKEAQELCQELNDINRDLFAEEEFLDRWIPYHGSGSSLEPSA
ncbi:hypothetical protein GYMLUDRAFT_60420 [Collybiopsis luxurians FD-317 M1]|uniref:Uncharacterized protein n=1 Tax=Collybiopsis luxurians FD-317 M1 TaxID=944289 RepID=A0A0D0B663_9AGAR|nr:hypothetical protein GYMLUDRAFT_60420 [Collybiopsis luxurians FD-317 M1]